MRSISLIVILSALGSACGAPADLPEDSEQSLSTAPVYATQTDDGATSLAVKNGVTLTLHAQLAWATASSGETLVLRGSTSETLTSVQGFIPDDGFGTPTQLGAKSFQLVYDNPSDINTIISGEPFYLILGTHSTTAGDRTWSAQLYVAPRLVSTDVSPTTRLALGSAITPTAVSTNPQGVVFRGTLTTTVAPQSISLTTGSGLATLVQDAPHAWHADWDFSAFESVAAGGAVSASAKFGATTSKRSGVVEIRVARVGLAPGSSPDDIYGFPVCDPAVAACLTALPAGADTGSCGAYFPVTVCQNSGG
jgi:hypothetical protein